MSMSLRDQLLKAGLVTEKQARQAEQQQRHQQQKQPKAPRQAPPPELTPAAKQALAAKAARDQELNRRQQEKAARKAITAQVRQLIEQSRVPRVDSDDYFNFQDGAKIRRIPVDSNCVDASCRATSSSRAAKAITTSCRRRPRTGSANGTSARSLRCPPPTRRSRATTTRTRISSCPTT